MTTPDRTPVAISCHTPRDENGAPALDAFGRPTFIMRVAHLDTGAVLTAEVPAGSREALGAVADMGAQVLEMLTYALDQINAEDDQ